MSEKEHRRPEAQRYLASDHWLYGDGYLDAVSAYLDERLELTWAEPNSGRMLAAEELAERMHRLAAAVHCIRRRPDDVLTVTDLDDVTGIMDLACTRQDTIALWALYSFTLGRDGTEAPETFEWMYFAPKVRQLLRALDKAAKEGQVMTLDEVLEAYPTLNDHGFTHREPMPNVSKWVRLREQLIQSRQQVTDCANWLRQHIKKRGTIDIDPNKNSYARKHHYERHIGEYITNGAFIAAALMAGFDCEQEPRTAHARFNMSRTSWHPYDGSREMIAEKREFFGRRCK